MQATWNARKKLAIHKVLLIEIAYIKFNSDCILFQDEGFILQESGHVLGSGSIGAKFGTAIAELGDVDGDGFSG